jgi:hypothetical protein
MSEPELDTLAAFSADNNERLGITGLLAYNGFNFMQLLEGEAGRIDALMDRIKDDPRHSGIVVVRREPITERECGAWFMTARSTPLGGLGSVAMIVDALPGSFRDDTRKVFTSFASLVR